MINLNKIDHKIASSDPNVSSIVIPEIIHTLNGNKEWRVNGLLHREDGPAVECENGTKEWCINGEYHREDGPAIEYGNGAKSWYINGKRHRENGPAIERENGAKLWYLNGHHVSYDPETWDQLVQESHIEHVMDE